MNKAFVMLFLTISSIASGTNYYVKNGGSDAANGLTDLTAWATISKINGRSFSPGDSILFKRGSIWREQLTVPSSGAAGNYITFGNYGTSSNPLILGSTQAVSWTAEGHANIWVSATSVTDPYNPTFPYGGGSTYGYEIFFVTTPGNVTWGVAKKTYTSNFSNLTAEFNWTWNSNQIYIYSPTDPNSRYTSVEVPARASCIFIDNKQYITIDGIDMQFASARTVWTEYPQENTTGLTIKNCHISYVGCRAQGLGYHLAVCRNDLLVQNNEIHDGGRRNTSVHVVGTDNLTFSNIIFEDNNLHDGYHSSGVGIVNDDSETGNSFNNIIIRRNFIWDNPARHAVADGFDANEMCTVKAYSSGCTTNNIQIYDNIWAGSSQSCIWLDHASNVSVYNNTFYSQNTLLTSAEAGGIDAHLYISDGCIGVVVKNNIFYGLCSYAANYSACEIIVTDGGRGQSLSEIFCDYNLFYQADDNLDIIHAGSNYKRASWATMKSTLGWQTHDPGLVNPQFISEPNDLHLSTSSPAIGAGIAIPGITTDYEGKAFINPPNIGCYATLVISNNPVYVSSVIENAAPSLLSITYNLSLANIVPAASAFTVRVNTVARTVTGVSISGTKVQLTLSSPVVYGDVVTVAYTKPAGNPLQTPAGGQAATISAQAVTNNVNSVNPVYTSSVVQNATPTLLSITYNLSLANIVPAASAFTVRVNTVARTVTGVSISGTKVQLTLSSPAVNGDVVTVAYNKPATNPLQTASGGQAVTISAQSVTNNIGHSNDPPVIVLNYLTSCNSGFIGEIDASGTYDLNNDNLIFEWSSPDNVPISSVTDPDIQFLAPVVSARDTIEFIVKVTDGIAIQSKTIQIVILPYKPGLDEAKIVNIAAVNYSAPDYPNNIADGKTETQWSSKGDDQWIISGLFSPFKISYLLLSFPNDQTGDVFDIYASKDSLTWDPVLINAASCSFSGNLQVFDFPASFAGNEYSFVKIIGHGNATDTWNHISELKIYGYSQEKQLSSSKTNIILFPNPAQTFFNISFEEPLLKPVSVKIIDESGKLMYDNIIAAGINNLQIPVNFKTGFYIVEMYSEGIIIGVKKLLIHK